MPRAMLQESFCFIVLISSQLNSFLDMHFQIRSLKVNVTLRFEYQIVNVTLGC